MITRLDALDAVKEDWEAIARVDRWAGPFVSWPWMRGWLESRPHEWLVLALRRGGGRAGGSMGGVESRYAAFLPLGFSHWPHWFRIDRRVTLTTGGFPAADSAGMVCLPGYEHAAARAFAACIQDRLDWDRFELREISDPRIHDLAASLDPHRFGVTREWTSASPQIQLPPTWESYLEECVGPATRKTIRRRERAITRLDGFAAQDIDESNADEQIETLLDLWKRRWGESELAMSVASLRLILQRCFEAGTLSLKTLRLGQTPIAAAAGFIDRVGRRYCGYTLGVDPEYRRFSPGTVLIAMLIRESIEKGLRCFDFLRGNEPYKYTFGAVDRFNRNFEIERHTVRSTVRLAASSLRDRMAIRTRTRASVDWVRRGLAGLAGLA